MRILTSGIQRRMPSVIQYRFSPWINTGISFPANNYLCTSLPTTSTTSHFFSSSSSLPSSSSSSSSSSSPSSEYPDLHTIKTQFSPQDAENISRVILRRHSVGKFNPTKPVSEDVMKNILALTLRSPTSFNSSPYRVIIVDDSTLKQELSLCMLGRGNSLRILQAPVTAVFLADCDSSQVMHNVIELEHSQGKPVQYLRNLSMNPINFTGGGGSCKEGPVANIRSRLFNLGSSLVPLPIPNSTEGWAFKNTSLAAMTYMLAATGYGIGTHPMEGFDSKRVKKVLNIPDRYCVPLIIPTGYEIQEFENNPHRTRNLRVPSKKIFYRNNLQQSYPDIPNV